VTRSHRRLLVFAVAAATAFACGKGRAQSGAAEDEKKEPEAVPVEVVALVRGPIEQLLRYSTHLEAERAVEVRAEAARKLVALLVEEGDRVAAGQPLARLEDEEQRTALARIEGQLERARRELARREQLFAGGMLSEQELSDARHEREQLELALADARRALSYTTVRAPIAGRVTERLVRRGDQVSLNQHLFSLVDFDSLVALVYVPERELGRLAAGQQVRLTPPAAPGQRFAGRVDRIAPVVDPKSGTVKVTVAVPYVAGLRPGMFLEAELVTAVEQNALLVPKRALVPDGTLVSLWRLADEDRVERVWVEIRLEDRERVTVAEGLAPGDRVVVAGQAGLKPDSRVRVLVPAEVVAAAEGAEVSGGTD
jgi:membrane fusion protein, multidrug efflux system